MAGKQAIGFCWSVVIAALITAGVVSSSYPQIRHQQQKSLQGELDEASIRASPLLSLHKDLVEIESISGNEHAVAKYLEKYLKSRSFKVELQPVAALDNNITQSQRYNILAYSGNSRQTRLLLSSHIDTVPPYIPYKVIPDKALFGRGTVDAKGCVATQITALLSLLSSSKIEKNDASLLFVVGEELGGDGMRTANELGLSWETVIFGEPTELKLASGHKGILSFEITAHGKAGHSGYPWLGENANSMLLPTLVALDNLELPSSKKYGNSTLNIGHVVGGVAGNVIPGLAKAQVSIRLAAGPPSKTKNIVLDAIEKINPKLETVFWGNGYGPIDIDADVEGFENIIVNYGTDIPNLEGEHRRHLYGPGSILVAHSDDEAITMEDLESAVEGYEKLVLSALERGPKRG
ncbi:MAG: hypothetical protein MMC33_006416 [Icmadophila ericetorum]|nr:hypothetical protein [Icmadophila ericetorum]